MTAALVTPGALPNHVRPLLACGHRAEDTHEASSTWDFPDDALWCVACQALRQLDVELQRRLVSEPPGHAWDEDGR